MLYFLYLMLFFLFNGDAETAKILTIPAIDTGSHLVNADSLCIKQTAFLDEYDAFP